MEIEFIASPTCLALLGLMAAAYRVMAPGARRAVRVEVLARR